MPATRVCSSTTISTTPRPFPPSGARCLKTATRPWYEDLPGLARLLERLPNGNGDGQPAAAAVALPVAPPAAAPGPEQAPADKPVSPGPAAVVAAPETAEIAPAQAVPEATADGELLGGVAAAMALVKAHRMHGHLAARLDPLGSEPSATRHSTRSASSRS